MEKIKLLHAYNKATEQNYFKGSWFTLMRPMTWTGTINPILTGTAFAAMTYSINFKALVIILLSALLVQMSANMLNDYFDFKNGQDTDRWTTETSDKQGAWWPKFHQIPWVAFGVFSLAVILGVWIAMHFGWWIGIIGIIGILVACLYSAGERSLAALGLGEFTGAIFLGFVPFVLGYAVQHQPITVEVFLVGLPFALLIATMILTNNIRDIEKDEGFRQTLPMKIGRRLAVGLLYVMVISAYVTVILLLGLKFIFWPAGIVIFACPMVVKLLQSVRANVTLEERNQGMKWAALHHWQFGLLYAIGIWLGTVF